MFRVFLVSLFAVIPGAFAIALPGPSPTPTASYDHCDHNCNLPVYYGQPELSTVNYRYPCHYNTGNYNCCPYGNNYASYPCPSNYRTSVCRYEACGGCNERCCDDPRPTTVVNYSAYPCNSCGYSDCNCDYGNCNGGCNYGCCGREYYIPPVTFTTKTVATEVVKIRPTETLIPVSTNVELVRGRHERE